MTGQRSTWWSKLERQIYPAGQFTYYSIVPFLFWHLADPSHQCRQSDMQEPPKTEVHASVIQLFMPHEDTFWIFIGIHFKGGTQSRPGGWGKCDFFAHVRLGCFFAWSFLPFFFCQANQSPQQPGAIVTEKMQDFPQPFVHSSVLTILHINKHLQDFNTYIWPSRQNSRLTPHALQLHWNFTRTGILHLHESTATAVCDSLWWVVASNHAQIFLMWLQTDFL